MRDKLALVWVVSLQKNLWVFLVQPKHSKLLKFSMTRASSCSRKVPQESCASSLACVSTAIQSFRNKMYHISKTSFSKQDFLGTFRSINECPWHSWCCLPAGASSTPPPRRLEAIPLFPFPLPSTLKPLASVPPPLYHSLLFPPSPCVRRAPPRFYRCP